MSPLSSGVLGAATLVSSPALWLGLVDRTLPLDVALTRYLVALAGRVVTEVGSLTKVADARGRRLPTLAIDTEVGFASAEDRAAFAEELTAAVVELVARYQVAESTLVPDSPVTTAGTWTVVAGEPGVQV